MSAVATGGPSSSQAFLHAAVTYLKLPGTLSMERSGLLRWTPSSASAASSALSVDESTIMGIKVSAEGQKQVVMVLELAEGVKVGPEGKNRIFLYFTGGMASGENKEKALADRESFKSYLIDVVQKNKTRSSGSASTSEAPSPAPVATESLKAKGTTSGTNTPLRKTALSKSGPSELELRISVLKANPSLAILHQDVVMSKQISDQEFWSHPTRRALLNAERASMEQRQGRNARIADPRPTANETGEMRINMTPELVRDLKAQYPVVACAFEENVPSVMDEPTFWKRYFSSKLYHRLRTSARSQASQHTVQPDDILDKYIEEDDDGLEPRKEYNAHDAFLDLGATAEDHGETGNEKDWTMRAGVERRTLPLMRRFNDHSQSLLDSALGEHDEEMRRKRRADAMGENRDEEESDDGLVIDELQKEDHNKRRRLLDVNDQRSLFDGRGGEHSQTQGKVAGVEERHFTAEQIHEMVSRTTKSWDSSLNNAIEGRSKDFSSAMASMLANVQSRQEARAWRRANDMPDTIQKALVTQNASTTEFLRQLWAAIAPQPLQDGTMANDTSASVRRARAKRMFNSLRSSKAKFAQIVQDANVAQSGLGDQRVKAAVVPIQTAIEKALHLPLSGGSGGGGGVGGE